jgi:multimeric flavodoxin WrbA
MIGREETIFVILVDWVNDTGDSDTRVYLFDTLDKAKAQLQDESVAELEEHFGDSIYFENCDNDMLKEVISKVGDDFNRTDKYENANWVIYTTPTYFSCYKRDEYSTDHINVQILEREVK